MEKLYLFNTLTREKEAFKPMKGKSVGLYSCGPTVYWYQHIGNMRTYVFVDLLKRVLSYNGYKVKHVMNVTDVGHLTSDRDEGEDKIEIAAKKEHKSAKEITNFYLKIFLEDMKKLNILSPDITPKATEHIKEQIDLIKKLEKKHFTYKTDDGIYFDSSRFKNYHKLANLNVEGLQMGASGAIILSLDKKRHKTDFALWKFSEKPGARMQEWKSPWGVGYPGWHLECSAMSMKYLGERFDIHTGGEDHIPIHHTNEIAQSEAATGKRFVNYWLHGAFLTFHGEKVSKSKGGLYTISELDEIGYKPEHFRYLCLLTHYRKKLDFSVENLSAARNAYERLKRKVIDFRKFDGKGSDDGKKYRDDFLKAVNDDLNLPGAMHVVWNLVDSSVADRVKIKILEDFDGVLGLNVKGMKEHKVKLSREAKHLIDEREKARKNKDFLLADKIRSRLKELGYVLEDRPEGPKFEKIK